MRKSGYSAQENIYISGFGTRPQLSKAYLANMRNDECQKRLRQVNDKILISKKQLCVQSYPGPSYVKACTGDYGGPAFKIVDLFYEKAIKNSWTEDQQVEAMIEAMENEENLDAKRALLVGVIGHSLDCGESTPGVYARVSEYLNWIKLYVHEWYTVDDQTVVNAIN